MGGPWTDAETATLRDLHATEGMTLTRAAKTMGRSRSTVSDKSKVLGLSWERPAHTVIATQARNIDIRARKSAAAAAELELLELAQAQLREGMTSGAWTTVLRGEGGAESEVTVTKVPARDLRDHATARAASAQVITRLADDADSDGLDRAKSTLGAIAEALRSAAPPPE